MLSNYHILKNMKCMEEKHKGEGIGIDSPISVGEDQGWSLRQRIREPDIWRLYFGYSLAASGSSKKNDNTCLVGIVE